jgi:hypothetical protein
MHNKYLASISRIELLHRARICKRLWSPGIDSEESIPPVYVAWRAGTTILVLSYGPARLGIDSWAPEKVYKYGLRSTAHYLHWKGGGGLGIREEKEWGGG